MVNQRQLIILIFAEFTEKLFRITVHSLREMRSPYLSSTLPMLPATELLMSYERCFSPFSNVLK